MKHANVAIFVPHLGCPHDCSFCNQRKISGSTEIPSRDDVKATAAKALSDLGERAKDAEIAFFGGSFTAIEHDYMISLLEAASPFVGDGGFKGIRVSTRPDAIDEDILDTLKRYRVTAIELGAQSMDDNVLMLNRRGHTAEDVRRASQLISQNGFELGLQMMTGLYGDTPQGAIYTAQQIAVLRPKTVRIYPTIVVSGTELAALYESGRYQPQSLTQAVSLCSELLEFFEREGIKVIRLGLHAGESLERGTVAGPWHPAFRELCESAIYLKKAKIALKDYKGNNVNLRVNNTEISKLIGQHRDNINKLSDEFKLKITVKAAEMPINEVQISADE